MKEYLEKVILNRIAGLFLIFFFPSWGRSGLEMVMGNFQCRGILQIWMIVGQGPVVLAVGADKGCLDIFFVLASDDLFFFLLSG